MKSVSGTTLSTSLTVVAGVTWGLYVNARDAAGNVSQASTTVPITAAAVPGRHPGADRAHRADRRPRSGTTVTLTLDRLDRQRRRPRLRRLPRRRQGRHRHRHGDHAARHDVHRQRAGRRHALPVPRRRPRRAGQRVGAQQHRRPSTTGAACGNSVCAVDPGRHRHRHPVGPGHPAGRHDPLHPARRARHRPAQPGHRREDHRRHGARTCRAPTARAACSAWRSRPTFASDHWLYIMHTSPTDNRIVRIKLTNDTLQHRHRAGAAQRHPAQQVPRRRPAAVRPGRQAVRQHRRRAERRQRAEH